MKVADGLFHGHEFDLSMDLAEIEIAEFAALG